MKIAVFHNLPKGGAKRVAEGQIKYLGKKHQVDVYTLGQRPSGRRWKIDFFKFWTLRKIHRELAQKIDKKGYDVVLVHPSRFTQAPYLLGYLKTPSVYYLHEPLRMAYEYHLRFQKKVGIVKKIYEGLTRAALRKIDFENTRAAKKILVNSYHTLEAVIKVYGVYPQVCYPGVDTHHFRPLVKIKKEGILFVAKPSRMTGFDFLKQAVSLIELKPKIRVIQGNLPEKQLVNAYNEAFLTTCTSEVEPFGLVPLESMACQTPVVAVKEGGYRESVIDGVTGFLVDREPKLFAEKIKLLLENSQSAKKMGKAGRKYIKKEWNWKKSIKQLEELLNEAIGFNYYC